MSSTATEAPCIQQSCPGGRGGLEVLNAAPHGAVLERTIVEAFVKLVVCRTVTVQRVAAVSGRVLDSRTTQEEESPVILEVNRHEVSGGRSTRWSSTWPLLAQPPTLDHGSRPHSPSSPQPVDVNNHKPWGLASQHADRNTHNAQGLASQHADSNTHNAQGLASQHADRNTHNAQGLASQHADRNTRNAQGLASQHADSDRDTLNAQGLASQHTDSNTHNARGLASQHADQRGTTLDSAPSKGPSLHCALVEAGSVSDTQDKSGDWEESEVRKCSLHKPSVCKESCEMPSSQKQGESDVMSFCERSELGNRNASASVGLSHDVCEEAGLKLGALSSSEEESRIGQKVGPNQCTCSKSEAPESVASCRTDPEMPAGAGRRTCKRQDPGEVTWKESTGLTERKREEMMEDCSGETTPQFESASQRELRLGPERQTEHASERTASNEQDVDMVSSERAASDGMGEPVSAPGESLVLGAHRKSSTASIKDTVVKSSDYLENSHIDRDFSDESGRGWVKQASKPTGEVREEAGEMDCESGSVVQGSSSQALEDDSMEQDMLVIDISNTLLEPTLHTADHQHHTQSYTDSEHSQSNTDTEQTPPGTEEGEHIGESIDSSPQTCEHTDISSSGGGTDQGAHSSGAEKPVPFFHLLTNFPVRERSHSKASSSSDKSSSSPVDKSKRCSQKHNSSAGSAFPSSTAAIKEEPDDDCMITAAFMFPSRGDNTASRGDNRNRPGRTSSHPTATSVGPGGRGWRGGGVYSGAAQQFRHIARRRGGPYPRHTPQLLQRADYPVNVNMTTATVTTTPTSAVGFPTRVSSSSSSSSSQPDNTPFPSTTAPTTSPAYIPNFLATTSSEVSEGVNTGGGVLSALDSRGMAGGGGLSALDDWSMAGGGGLSAFEDQCVAGLSTLDERGMTGLSALDGGPVSSSQTFQCPLCNKIFMHHPKFARHAAMCGGRRPFRCKICGKAFNQRAHLDTHLKFHMGIKRHRCDVCHKAYVMKGDLIRHLKTRGHLLAMQTYGMPVHS
ncbi:hypothetical protein ACOMHN_022781 [Nucella lapillus]